MRGKAHPSGPSHPAQTEQVLATIPGCAPNSAIRLRVEPGPHGYVRLEHLGHSEALGWYTQKSLCIPAEALHDLLPQLRKAQLLMPRARHKHREAHLLPNDLESHDPSSLKLPVLDTNRRPCCDEPAATEPHPAANHRGK